jgi:hypothetical protein
VGSRDPLDRDSFFRFLELRGRLILATSGLELVRRIREDAAVILDHYDLLTLA